MVYQWGSRKTFGLDPNVAGKEVERIVAKCGGVADSAAIVEHSRKPKAPLHAAIFSETDEEAALARRRDIARSIVNSLLVVEVDDDGGSRATPGFFAISVQRGEDREQGYQSRAVVLSDEAATESAEQILLKQLNGLRRRYNGLTEFKNVWAEVDRVGDTLSIAA